MSAVVQVTLITSAKKVSHSSYWRGKASGFA